MTEFRFKVWDRKEERWLDEEVREHLFISSIGKSAGLFKVREVERQEIDEDGEWRDTSYYSVDQLPALDMDIARATGVKDSKEQQIFEFDVLCDVTDSRKRGIVRYNPHKAMYCVQTLGTIEPLNEWLNTRLEGSYLEDESLLLFDPFKIHQEIFDETYS